MNHKLFIYRLVLVKDSCMDLKNEFLSRVIMIPFHECWEWGMSIGNHGYGYYFDRGIKKLKVAHRASYEIHFGPIPPGMLVCHRCDNRSCVRPDHLFLGTHIDNMRDKYSKGRDQSQKQTHCRKGHEYTPDNLINYLKIRGLRVCKICKRESRKRYNKKPESILKRALYRKKYKN